MNLAMSWMKFRLILFLLIFSFFFFQKNVNKLEFSLVFSVLAPFSCCRTYMYVLDTPYVNGNEVGGDIIKGNQTRLKCLII